MNAIEREKITVKNEEKVRQWFESSGFTCDRPDAGNLKGKRADWKCTKNVLVLLCEVKTIFSGGQVGPHNKEEAYSKFESEVKGALMSDSDLNHLPLKMTLFVQDMSAIYNNDLQMLIDHLKTCLHRAYQNPSANEPIVPCEFVPNRGGKINAWIQYLQWSTLQVGFMRAPSDYNRDAFERNIRNAIAQLKELSESLNLKEHISIVALCSESRQLDFHSSPFSAPLPVNSIGKLSDLDPQSRNFDQQLERAKTIIERHELIDWAFSDFQNDLTAIMLLDRYQPTDHAYFITSPHRTENVKDLKNTITTKNCSFLDGMDQQMYQDADTLLDKFRKQYPLFPIQNPQTR